MPIKNCPFTDLSGDGFARPVLPIKIINPHTKLSFQTFGIIDTGADDCALPAIIAEHLGHVINKGVAKQIQTGNGISIAYAHTTSFKIYHPLTNDFIFKTKETPIDCLPNLNVVLLGVRNFMSSFVLHIDYPKQIFSITKP